MTRTRLALATLVAACLLAACSDDEPEPKIPDPTESATSAPTASETVSTSPTVSATPTTSAQDGVDQWLSAWSSALQTGDTTSVKNLSSDGCESCMRLIAKVDEVYGNGGRYETDGWRATRVSEAPDSVDETPSFVMQVVQTRRTLYDEDGQVVDTAEQTTTPMRMTFAPEGGSWLLDRLEILE